MMLSIKIIFCVSIFAVAAAVNRDQYKSYAGYQVYEVVPKTKSQLNSLNKLTTEVGYDFWKEPTLVNQPVHINVSPQLFSSFSLFLQSNQLLPKVLIEDVGSLISAERSALTDRRSKPSRFNFDYEVYHTLAEINQWLLDFASNYSDKVTVVNVGSSYEGRTISALKISTGTGKRAFWLDAGIHCREWIAPTTAMWIAREFVEKYGIDSEITNLVDSLDWYILPVFNVDGYEFTWTTDRLWRKTRSINEGSPCNGTDPNRNWDFHWSEVGASNIPCADTYCGSAPFSEIEVESVVEYLSALPLAAYFAYHSYGQMYMTPYGYTADLPADYDLLKAAGDEAVNAISDFNGMSYECSTIESLVGLASGSSVDYVYGVLGLTYSYGIELRDEGQNGFVLPESEIRPTAEESIEALKIIAGHVISNLS